jgi:hypothetical protein
MKRLSIFLIGILYSLLTYSQDYVPFPDSNAIWNSKYGGYYGTPIVRFGLNGDTIINSHVSKYMTKIYNNF